MHIDRQTDGRQAGRQVDKLTDIPTDLLPACTYVRVRVCRCVFLAARIRVRSFASFQLMHFSVETEEIQ